MSTDVGASKSFMGSFDWDMKDMPMDDNIHPDQRRRRDGGGLMKNPMPGAKSSWLAYVLVDDVKRQPTRPSPLARRSEGQDRGDGNGRFRHHH